MKRMMVLGMAMATWACGGEAPDVDIEGPPAAVTTPADESPAWNEGDWDIFSSKVRWSAEEGLDTLPMGEAMARLGETFVGTEYVPGTLNPDGPERIVINFRGLDCVTFVENVYATVRFVKEAGPDALADREQAQNRYEAMLEDIRYRGGMLDGYASRLHYFSEWIADNAERGLVENITAGLPGAVEDPEPIDFMTTHTESYPQLADSSAVAEIRASEERLNAAPRTYIPQEDVAAIADRIRNGDIIAATSTVEGLDIAHTGLALWIDGALHLMHAPLVGEDVQISEIPLADRLLGIGSQDGLMVARPQAPGAAR